MRAKDNIKNIVCEVCGAGEGKIKLEKILKKIRVRRIKKNTSTTYKRQGRRRSSIFFLQ